ncbi:hypothetical protein [Bombiscardovia coagulans]|uniref:Uncharacterized protein n=1 Tax=Bombiscardovia coagulans TaxID=686666 RepID=A0A261ESJ2_9BIFI|nr:hypothetical protein [Bombiscardovia coagulans]OZG49824.1 hypothetical protein BOCO_0341 [Bombiscardovia coagulans]
MVAYWIQGLRSDVDKYSDSWIPLTYGRILGTTNSLPSGTKTSQSESLLNIGANSYYYVGFEHPSFGRQVFAFEPDFSDMGRTLFKVSPFDTGAVATGRISTVSDEFALNTPEQKKALVSKYSFGRCYQDQFSEWTKSAYDTTYVSEYVGGKVPSKHYCAEIAIPSSGSVSDARCWVWEARTSKETLPDTTSEKEETVNLKLCHIWITADDMDFLKGETIRNLEYAIGDRKRIINFLNNNTKVTRVEGLDASREARRWLEVNQQW